MTKDEALHKALKVLNCLNNDRVYETTWVKSAINACEEALETPECNPHPKAPHGFCRNASHSAGRYVCECESWTPPEEIQACKEALEQPAQEPVEYLGALATMDGSVNLYYKKSSWQELSGDDMHKIIVKYVSVDCTCDPYEFARAIEQELKTKNGFSALKEKNT